MVLSWVAVGLSAVGLHLAVERILALGLRASGRQHAVGHSCLDVLAGHYHPTLEATGAPRDALRYPFQAFVELR